MGWGAYPFFAFPFPLLALVALVRGLVVVVGKGAARGGKLFPEISTTEAGEEGCADNGVGVTSRDSMGAGVESLSHPNASAVWEGAGEGLVWWKSL
jgi:hypothetical protein